MTTIVLVEDETMVRLGLRELIEAEGDLEVVGEAADGVDALAVVQRARPEVVVMDIRLPALDGIEATRRIVALPDPPAVLLLTTFGSDQYLLEGLRAGASGFFLKSASPEQLAEAIRTVASGESIVSPRMTRALIDRIVGVEPRSGQSLDMLSARELEVLEWIARGASNHEIARQLHLALPTVKSHVRHILAKLGVPNRLQLIVLARSSGLGASSS
jgi:DNA-binding NarL/FixJ family response regulator